MTRRVTPPVMITPGEIRDQVMLLATAPTEADLAEIRLLMQFERSREGWANIHAAHHGEHPRWPRFAAARLVHRDLARLGPVVLEELHRRYPPEGSWCLPDGSTQWVPAAVLRKP